MRQESVKHKKKGGKKITRKQFFQRIGMIVLLPLAGVWYSTAERSTLRNKQNMTEKIPPDLPEGISFFGAVIVSKEGDKIEVFSSKCTHLGCRINKEVNGVMVCPCHGSEFSENGKVVRGPANKPLVKLPYTINPKTGEMTVDVEA